MTLQPNIAKTILYSLFFAMGGAPTIAMQMIRAQTHDPAIMYQALIGLSVIIACILVPIILIQNTYLLIKRNDEKLEQKIAPLGRFYLLLDGCCLVYWLYIQFAG